MATVKSDLNSVKKREMSFVYNSLTYDLLSLE